jgi:hypothetical protein
MVEEPHDYTRYLVRSDVPSHPRLTLGIWPGAISPLAGLDSTTLGIRQESVALYSHAVDCLTRVFIMKQDLPICEASLELLTGQGKSGWEDGKWVGTVEDLLLVTDLFNDLNAHLKSRANSEIRSLDDMIKWDSDHPVRTILVIRFSRDSNRSTQEIAFATGRFALDDPTRQHWLDLAIQSKGQHNQAYTLALAPMKQWGNEFEQYMTDHSLDALLFATGWGNSHASDIAVYIGGPVANVPFGQLSNGMPQGLQLVGKRGGEGTLIDIM